MKSDKAFSGFDNLFPMSIIFYWSGGFICFNVFRELRIGAWSPPMSPFNNPVVLDLLARYRSIAAMTHASALLGWDLEINMPEAGASARGQSQSEIELLRQKMTID